MKRAEETILWDKATALCEKLKLEEKIKMIHGAQLFQTAGVPRLGIPPLKMSDGPMGVRQEFYPDSWKTVGLSDDYVTYLPCNSALASTWNRELAYETGKVLGEEARGRGKDVILGPGINIKRSPLCGRNFEYFSEDPCLTGEMAVPYIKGIQESDVAACVKHFAANNQETERLRVEVDIEEEALRDIYLPAFRMTVEKGDSYTIMGAYNKLYGQHCCQSDFLLKKVLREEWGYDGVVISDWGAIHDTTEASMSQLDIEMSVTNDFDQYYMAEPLKEMVEKGAISESVVNEKVKRILVLMQRLHMFDENRKTGSYNTPKHRLSALEVARESIVLLKNKNRILPLEPEKTKKLLVIGDNADRLHASGGGSAEIKALYEISPLMGIKTLLGGNAEVKYVPGYCIDESKSENDANWQETSLEDGGGKPVVQAVDDIVKEKRKALREEAVALAKEYKHVIIIGGLNHHQDKEGNDRLDMKLPYDQDILIQELLKANAETIVVMVGGSSVEMESWVDQAKSIVWSWYAGMEGGSALAEVLFGKINPSGKLPETFYKKHTNCSAHTLGEFPGGKTVKYTEGSFVGYRYNDTFGIEPEFCFGHGLSYTSFEYSNLKVTDRNGKTVLDWEIENTGDRYGKEIAQVYVVAKNPGKDRPVRELKGFIKVGLEPKERKQVSLEIPMDGSDHGIQIGSSLGDIRLSC